jgi:hemolysin activation/secretion protein
VKQFNVVGSTVFTAAELAEVTAPFTQRPINFSELLQARSAVTKLYVDNGYTTSLAFVPPGQEITNGIVTLQVIEGTLEAIQVTGNQRLSTRYVRDRLATATQTPLNVNKLLEALQVLQLNPLILTISAELSAGPRPGVSLLEVTILEARSFRPQIILDNQRSPSVGSFQRQIQLNEANLSGHGDAISLTYVNTDGIDDLSFSYAFPINPRNGTLGVNFSQIWSRVIAEPFDVLQLNGTSRDINLTYRQPVIQTPRQELALGITGGRRESETFLLGERSPLSPGADAEGRTRLSALRLFQEWTQRNRTSVLALRSEFSVGLPLGATDNPTSPDGEFLLWRGQAQWVKQLAPDTLILLRSNLQFADRALVPLEQFGLGGLDSVRGYPQDLLLVDNGIYAAVEARIPIFRVTRRDGVFQLVPFFDLGHGFNNSDRPIEGSNTLAALGVGIRFQWSDQLSARLDWGVPLISTGAQSSGFEDSQIFFSIGVSP